MRFDNFHSDPFPSPHGYRVGDSAVRRLPIVRPHTMLLVGKDPPTYAPDEMPTYDPAKDGRLAYRAFLDTGAYLSVFPKRFWIRFADQIAWIQACQIDSSGTFSEVQSIIGHGIGGGRASYRLGSVWAGAYDNWQRRLPAVPVLALFQLDDGPGDWILLGRWGGICEGRFLYQEPPAHDEPEVGLPPDTPPNFHRTYGMKLWLVDY